VKLTEAGDMEWSRSFGGSSQDYGEAVTRTNDGGWVIGGITSSHDGDVHGLHTTVDIWLIRLNAEGDTLWTKCYGGTGHEYIGSIAQCADGGFFVAAKTGSIDGDVSSNDGGDQLWVVKLSDMGVIEWERSYGGSAMEGALDGTELPGEGFIVIGTTYSNDGDVSGSHGGAEAWVLRLDTAGMIEWERCYGGTASDQGQAIEPSDNGGYLITAFTRSNDGDVQGNHGSADIWAISIDDTGAIQWQRPCGSTAWEWTGSGAKNDHGGLVVAGHAYENDGDVSGVHGAYDFWIASIGASDIATQHIPIEAGSFHVSPVPSHGQIQITAPANAGRTELLVMDGVGRVVAHEARLACPCTLDLSFLAAGPYTLLLRTPKTTLVERFMIE
jgi:hypothetical protein